MEVDLSEQLVLLCWTMIEADEQSWCVVNDKEDNNDLDVLPTFTHTDLNESNAFYAGVMEICPPVFARNTNRLITFAKY